MATTEDTRADREFRRFTQRAETEGSYGDPGHLKKGELGAFPGADGGFEYYTVVTADDTEGAGLYDDFPGDYYDFPWAYPEHPEFRNYWGLNRKTKTKTEKELSEELQKNTFSSFFDADLPSLSTSSLASTDSEDSVVDVISDGKFEKLNLGAPKSFVDIQREKLLEKEQNANDSIFDETTTPRRLREDVLRKLFANFGVPQSNFSDIGFVPQNLSAIEQIKRGVFQPFLTQVPQVKPPESFVPKSTIQNILQPEEEEEEFVDVTSETNILRELAERFRPEDFRDVTGSTEDFDPFSQGENFSFSEGQDFSFSSEGQGDFAAQAEAAARGEAAIPGLETEPEMSPFATGFSRAISKGLEDLPGKLATKTASALIGKVAPQFVSPIGPFLPSPFTAALAIGKSAYAAYQSPYRGYTIVDVLQGALKSLLPGHNAEDFFANMEMEQEQFDLLVEDVFSNPFVTNEEMDIMLGRGFFGAEGEHGLEKSTPEKTIQDMIETARHEVEIENRALLGEQELDIDTSIYGPTFGFPSESGFDYGTLPNPPKGFFETLFSPIIDIFAPDPPAPPAASIDAFAGAMGIDDDDEDDPTAGTSGPPASYGYAALADDAAFGDPGDDPSESADQATDSDADGDSW